MPFWSVFLSHDAIRIMQALTTFQMCLISIFSNIIGNSVKLFMDDFSVFRSDFDKCLDHVNVVLKRCTETSLVLNWENSHFMEIEDIVLEHKILSKVIEVD